MAEAYTSRIALVLDEPVEHVGELVQAAIAAGDVDRASAVRGEPAEAMEVHWGGRMQRGVVRRLTDEPTGEPLLRTEIHLAPDGPRTGMTRQAQLLQGLGRQLRGRVRAVRDLSAMTDHDEGWLHRVAIGSVELDDAIVAVAEGEGTWWVRTHGAARFDVPDLELYGLHRGQVEPAQGLLRHVHEQLLRGPGLKTDVATPDGTPLYLVPVLEAWQHLPLDAPGVGKAGQDRGPGLDGPRATLSVLHKPRFGRYRKDLAGVLEHL